MPLFPRIRPSAPKPSPADYLPVRSTGAILTPDSGVAFALDVSREEVHELSAETTDHPVEEGSDVTDHIRERPFRLTVDGIVSAAPIGGEIDPRRPIDAWEALVALFEARAPLTVDTGLALYERMVLLRAPANRSAITGGELSVRLEFQQIRTVQSQSVRIPPLAPRPDVRAGVITPSDDGRQAVSPLSGGQQRRQSSVLAAATGAGR